MARLSSSTPSSRAIASASAPSGGKPLAQDGDERLERERERALGAVDIDELASERRRNDASRLEREVRHRPARRDDRQDRCEIALGDKPQSRRERIDLDLRRDLDARPFGCIVDDITDAVPLRREGPAKLLEPPGLDRPLAPLAVLRSSSTSSSSIKGCMDIPAFPRVRLTTARSRSRATTQSTKVALLASSILI